MRGGRPPIGRRWRERVGGVEPPLPPGSAEPQGGPGGKAALPGGEGPESAESLSRTTGRPAASQGAGNIDCPVM